MRQISLVKVNLSLYVKQDHFHQVTSCLFPCTSSCRLQHTLLMDFYLPISIVHFVYLLFICLTSILKRFHNRLRGNWGSLNSCYNEIKHWIHSVLPISFPSSFPQGPRLLSRVQTVLNREWGAWYYHSSIPLQIPVSVCETPRCRLFTDEYSCRREFN